MLYQLRRIALALASPAPEGGGPVVRLGELLQWIAALSVAVPVLLVTLGAFTEPLSHLYRPAWVQLLVQLPGALAIAVAAHYLRQGVPYQGLGRWLRWFITFWFVFFGGCLLALGVEVLWNAI